MQKLISELIRLFVLDGQQYASSDDALASAPAGILSPEILERHLRGEHSVALNMVKEAGLTRVLTIDFDGAAKDKGAQSWDRLSEVANALQAQLDLPAPAVSITGTGYRLWLSLQTPIALAAARQFLQLLRLAYFPDFTKEAIRVQPDPDLPDAPAPTWIELPPCPHLASGKWAAFIHPGMGASFSDEPGLEMAPPFAAQAAFLEGLRSISDAQFTQALSQLRHGQEAQTQPHAAPPSAAAVSSNPGLLLKDATLEDIVRHLHANNIEPTFRHLLKR